MCIFGLIGVIGNILTLCVLSRPKFCVGVITKGVGDISICFSQDCFHQLLLSLACYDTIFITCGGINYSCRCVSNCKKNLDAKICFLRGLNAGSLVFTVLFPYIIYPFRSFQSNNYYLLFYYMLSHFSHIGMIGSVFMTFAISIERFLGICYPLKVLRCFN